LHRGTSFVNFGYSFRSPDMSNLKLEEVILCLVSPGPARSP
jgi:hypothetical protein